MPPVADQESSEWERAMLQALQANEDQEGMPHTWFALSRALARREPKTQTADSWLSTIKRIRNGKLVPQETRAQLIADVLGIDRDQLPESSERLTLKALEARLAEAETALNAVGPALEDLVRRVALLEKPSPPRTERDENQDER